MDAGHDCLFSLIAIPLAAAPFWKPLLPRPRLALSVIEVAGQLRITWNPRAIRGPATIDIIDGVEQHRTARQPRADQPSLRATDGKG
jgi:hypothetical protein